MGDGVLVRQPGGEGLRYLAACAAAWPGMKTPTGGGRRDCGATQEG
jgi:hypothetical protein